MSYIEAVLCTGTWTSNGPITEFAMGHSGSWSEELDLDGFSCVTQYLTDVK